MDHLLDVKRLETVFNMDDGVVRAVEDASFYIDKGEIIGIVGESGSGKSVTMLSVMRLIPTPPGEITGGQVLFEGRDLLGLPPDGREMRAVRGGRIAMIFQEPMTSLNPVLTIGTQLEETIIQHLRYDKAAARARAAELMALVGIPDGQERLNYYPTQFSGGMRQRIMIAMAMASNPQLLIADEATTALDVTTQEQILELMRDIVRKTGTALIIITHNLSVVARYADRIYVMYAGHIIESADTGELFENPRHPYTRGLLGAIPRLDSDKSRQLLAIEGLPPNPAAKDGHCPFRARCRFACPQCASERTPPLRDVSPGHGVACHIDIGAAPKPGTRGEQGAFTRNIMEETLLELRGVKKYFPVTKGLLRRQIGTVKALDDVTFSIRRGETLGLVGESGCGKTTLAKAILHLHEVTGGTVLFEGRDITGVRGKELRALSRRMQFIFQDPYGSLDPRQTAGGIVGEPLIVHGLTKGRAAYNKRVDALFEAVGLDPALKTRVPHEFSGGQRQRLGIARALASDPSFIICDEPISALDVSIQAQIINLLIDLQKERGLSYLFIAHDLSVVRHISDRIVVMYLGRVMEISPWDKLYASPLHPYTKALLSAIPIPDPKVERERVRVRIQGEVPSLRNRPEGCVFHTRCPYAQEQCKTRVPPLCEHEDGHMAACFDLMGRKG